MIKKILLLSTTVLLIASCQHKSKSDESETKNQPTEQNISEDYQTIENEQQAAALDNQTQEQIEEIEVQDRIFFGYDSAEIAPDARKVLDTQIDWLKSDKTLMVTIEGHCDERGTREYNIALGEKRANSVRNYLTSGGVESSRIKTISYGKERPAFFGSSEEVMAKNRRAVTVVN